MVGNSLLQRGTLVRPKLPKNNKFRSQRSTSIPPIILVSALPPPFDVTISATDSPIKHGLIHRLRKFSQISSPTSSLNLR